MYLRPHAVKGIHIEGQVVKLAFIISDRTIGVAVELHNQIHEIPYIFVICMENVSAILMHVDAFHLLAVDITTKVWTLVYYKTFLAHLLSAIGKCGSEQARTNYEVIIVKHN